MRIRAARVSLAFALTAAMAVGLADRPWKVADLVGLLEADEREAVERGDHKRGPYGPREIP